MRKRSFAWFSALVAVLFATLAEAAPPAPPLELVSDVWPPFTDVDGKPREAIELVAAALHKGGVRSRFSIMTWSAAVLALEQGKVDGSAAVWKTPDREKYLLFSKPYLENRLVPVARKGTRVAMSSVSGFIGKRLCVTQDYAYGDAIMKAPNVELVVRKSDAECLRAVLSKQADYVLLDELMVRHLFDFEETKARALIVAGDTPLVRYSLYFALRKDHPQATQIMADFNRNIERMRADGTYNVVLKVPWIRADVDGDGVAEYVGSKTTTLNSGADPSASKLGYPIFSPEPGIPTMTRGVEYRIDGKSYNSWGDAATNLNRAGATKPQGLYKYSTGFVLSDF